MYPFSLDNYIIDLTKKHADEVDRHGRFPEEAIGAIKSSKLLGMVIPSKFGGMGCDLDAVVSTCFQLGKNCASTAMIFAMHQMQVASVVRHHKDSPWLCEFLESVAREQLLIASATSEENIGGAINKSECALNQEGNVFHVRKAASVISYGAHADAILMTARRSSDAPASDQVLVAITRENYKLEVTSDWDSLGMRGTSSSSFRIDAKADVQQIVPARYSEMLASTVLPWSHLTWSSLWLGIAWDAFRRTRMYIKSKLRGQIINDHNNIPSEIFAVNSKLNIVRANIKEELHNYKIVCESGSITSSYLLGINGLKVTSSEICSEIVQSCLRICGISGYRNNSPFSLGRHLRDISSSALMVHNDRIAKSMGGNVLLLSNSEDVFFLN